MADQSLMVAVLTPRRVVAATLKFGNSFTAVSIIALKASSLDAGDVVVHALDLEAERGGEVLLVADHDIDVLGDLAVHFLRLVEAADGLPERGTVVEIVGDDGAVFVGGLDGLDREGGGGFGERGVDAAGVEPAHAEFAEDVIPVDVAGLELRGGGVAAVGIADRAADAEAALGEIQAVADVAADAVVLAPLDEIGGDAALHDEILDEMADLVVHEGGDDGGLVDRSISAGRGRCCIRRRLPRPWNWRAVRMRPSPGSRRSMTSPSEI